MQPEVFAPWTDAVGAGLIIAPHTKPERFLGLLLLTDTWHAPVARQTKTSWKLST
ncbi:hypothetical protein CDEST_08259 [Colletotrichum destructivum]|uniref:Uncharacterized protein n=1 Tax=Colletotrichum destructivum TaxID=34406 RepID=A0AAX4IIE4_9PEZI|nr:hypothetical protein CDEST_08259 [Colletotrichum destructivum]